MTHSTFRGLFNRLFLLADAQDQSELDESGARVWIVGDSREPGAAIGGLQYRRFSFGGGGSENFPAPPVVQGFRAFADCVITSLWMNGTSGLTTSLTWRVGGPGLSVKPDAAFTRPAAFLDGPAGAGEFAPISATGIGGSAGADATGAQFWGLFPEGGGAAGKKFPGEPLFLRAGSTVLCTPSAAVANMEWGFSGYLLDIG